MNNSPSRLIRVLLDLTAEEGDRDDAAMDLGAFDAEEVEEALGHVACDHSTDMNVADSCGQSLAEIWIRRGSITQSILVNLAPSSLNTALGVLKENSPHLAVIANDMLTSH